MSLRSLVGVAVERDSAEPVVDTTGAVAEGEAEVGAAPPSAGASGLSSATGVLVAAIPGEVLAPYTALIGVVVSTASAKNDYATLRWWLFGIGTALVVVSLLATFYRARASAGRHVPFVEIVAATIAFASWGLVMPGSPLSLSVTGDDLTVATAIIAIGGAFFISLLSPTLASPSSKSPAAKA